MQFEEEILSICLQITDYAVKLRAMLKAEPGLEWDVVVRLQTLKQMAEFVDALGDPNRLLSCITSVISAYRSKELTWDEGKVTYWRDGKLVGGPPSIFEWDRFRELNSDNEGEGFWIEPVSSSSVFFLRQETYLSTDC